jgi:hypothetical protein
MAWMDKSMVSNRILELRFVTMGLWVVDYVSIGE